MNRNTVLVIEHNPDVIKCAGGVIDMGPEGGEDCGRVVAVGTPEQVVRVAGGHAAEHLGPKLKPAAAGGASDAKALSARSNGLADLDPRRFAAVPRGASPRSAWD